MTGENLEWCGLGPGPVLGSGPGSAEGAHDLLYAFAAIKIESANLVLDVSCGRTCGTASYLSKISKFVICFDQDPDLLANFKQHNIENAIAYNATLEPVPDSFSYYPPIFDAVVAIECIDHYEDYCSIVNALLRGLRPGGLFIFSVATTQPGALGHKHPKPQKRFLLEEDFECLDGDIEWYYSNWLEVFDERPDWFPGGMQSNLIGVMER